MTNRSVLLLPILAASLAGCDMLGSKNGEEAAPAKSGKAGPTNDKIVVGYIGISIKDTYVNINILYLKAKYIDIGDSKGSLIFYWDLNI